MAGHLQTMNQLEAGYPIQGYTTHYHQVKDQRSQGKNRSPRRNTICASRRTNGKREAGNSRRIRKGQRSPHPLHRPGNQRQRQPTQGNTSPAIPEIRSPLRRRSFTSTPVLKTLGPHHRPNPRRPALHGLQGLPYDSRRRRSTARIPRRTAAQKLHSSLNLSVRIPILFH